MSAPNLTPKRDPISQLIDAGKANGHGAGEGMDRRIEKPKWPIRKLIYVGTAVAFAALVFFFALSAMGGRKLNVDRAKVTLSTVEQRPFQEFITQNGNVLPRKTIYLDAVEGGRVEEVYKKEGELVEEGEPILRLSNNDLQLRLINADAQRIEQINRLQNTRFQLEQNSLSLRQQLTQMNYQLVRLERLYRRNEALHEKQLVSEQEFDQVRDEYVYWKRNKDLTLEAFKQDSLRMAVQIRQMQATVGRMDANFAIIQRVLDNLLVRAPVAGQLTALNPEVGELHPSGFRFGQIDVLDGYKVRANIDEYYINRVSRGQRATTQPIAAEAYALSVTRVYPEVRNGLFEVDLTFPGPVPPNIRRGQTIRFRLELGDPTDAVVVPRGGYYQTTGGNWIFVLDGAGSTASKRSIRLGRQNPQVFEVLEGLQPGETVITSSYEAFGEADRIVLR